MLEMVSKATSGGEQPSLSSEGRQMTQESISKKTVEQPSHETIDREGDATVGNESEQRKLDRIAMESAKRGGKEIQRDESTNSIFTKYGYVPRKSPPWRWAFLIVWCLG